MPHRHRRTLPALVAVPVVVLHPTAPRPPGTPASRGPRSTPTRDPQAAPDRARGGRTSGDGGQALPLLAGALVLVALLAVGLVRLGGAAAERARAHTAADAAALAAVTEGRPGAERTAGANGGRVTAYVESGGAVEVTVRVGDHQAVARARPAW